MQHQISPLAEDDEKTSPAGEEMLCAAAADIGGVQLAELRRLVFDYQEHLDFERRAAPYAQVCARYRRAGRLAHELRAAVIGLDPAALAWIDEVWAARPAAALVAGIFDHCCDLEQAMALAEPHLVAAVGRRFERGGRHNLARARRAAPKWALSVAAAELLERTRPEAVAGSATGTLYRLVAWLHAAATGDDAETGLADAVKGVGRRVRRRRRALRALKETTTKAGRRRLLTEIDRLNGELARGARR